MIFVIIIQISQILSAVTCELFWVHWVMVEWDRKKQQKQSEEFKQLHDERKKIIKEWEVCVKTMQQRDIFLQKLGEY